MKTPWRRKAPDPLAADEARFVAGTRSLADLVAPESLTINPRHLDVGGQCVRTLFVSGYPRSVGPGWLSPLIDQMSNEGCIGQISEIFEADEPHRPRQQIEQRHELHERSDGHVAARDTPRAHGQQQDDAEDDPQPARWHQVWHRCGGLRWNRWARRRARHQPLST